MTYSKKDIEDANKMYNLFLNLSERDKVMANGYLSALIDKTNADNGREQQDKPLAVAT